VRYAEVDQQGVVFNAHYLTYCDEAMGALCAEHGLLEVAERVQLVASTITWRGSARWGDVVEVDARCTRLGTSSLDIGFAIRVADTEVAQVSTTYVLTDLAGTAEALPEAVRRAFTS
jgi:acyl-CoA thioester hydrolase